ncbi:hypothetical protein BG015_004653, partial [Linnemannia schmuckeri]
MSNTYRRFFNIPELLDLVALHLDKNDVANLASTNRAMHRTCTPLLYRNLLGLGTSGVFKVFSSTAALQALARNIQHIRLLCFGMDELVHYYSCVLTSKDVTSSVADTPPVRRTTWMPATDTHTRPFVTLPPMTRLSQLIVNLNSKDDRYPASVRDPRVTMTQLCWLISLNADLISLHIDVLPVQDVRDAQRLAFTISGLSKLKELSLNIATRNGEWFELWSPTFFSAPSSLQSLRIKVAQSVRSFPLDNQSDLREEKEEEDDGVDAIVQKQEPLVSLEKLFVYGRRCWPSEIDVHSIFAHCPNVKRLDIPKIESEGKDDTIGVNIGKACPRIESLVYRASESSTFNSLPLRIMDSVPAQQFTDLMYFGKFADIDHSTTNNNAFQRHSTTLRNIQIDGVDYLHRISLSVILAECLNLEILKIPYYDNTGHYITLADAVEFPWSCTKLQKLQLTIDGCQLPVVEPGSAPYYSRPTPITLSQAEIQHFAQLEKFYRQIGALTSLQHLHLQTTEVRTPAGMNTPYWTYHRSTFPAMLSLPDTTNTTTVPGRPGFLHLLAGLKKLETLEGAVDVNEEETKVTVGWAEARWMDENWPLLRMATFAMNSSHMTPPFRWLVDKRKDEEGKEI